MSRLRYTVGFDQHLFVRVYRSPLRTWHIAVVAAALALSLHLAFPA